MRQRIFSTPPFVIDNVDNLKVTRVKKGMGLKTLAGAVNIRSQVIYRYETGCSFPSIEDYNKLAEFFGWRLWLEENAKND